MSLQTTLHPAKISTFVLVMFIVGTVDSIRNLPAAALFGSALIFFFIFSAIVFLIPTALVSAELASSWTEKGGICYWVKLAFGEKIAFMAIWLQWISNLVWFPTILSFVAGVVSYLIDPSLVHNKIYLISVILLVFWSLTLLNLKGIHVSSRFVTFCTITGMAIPMVLIIGLAIAWLILGNLSQVHFTAATLLPSFSHMDSWISLTAIMTSFAGMELAAVHVKEINNPQKSFPRALYISVWLILSTMILGSLAIAIVLPKEKINLVDGIMQAFTRFFAAYHISKIMPAITVMILIGTLGGIISWVISPAKGLLQAAQMGFLPLFLQKENKHGVAANLLITQAVLVSIICLVFLLMPSIGGSYWLLTALNIQLYMLMYVMMFISSLYLRYKFKDQPRAFAIPGGKIGMWFVCLLGLLGCAITLTVGFFPPAGINVGSVFSYEVIFISGIIVTILPTAFFYYYKQLNWAEVPAKESGND
ncbi:MAG: gadC [Gammaproteobacteria bacterium]|jgi:amino acid transporter|nr:gadC [Gammaproteobacteria bacterium]